MGHILDDIKKFRSLLNESMDTLPEQAITETQGKQEWVNEFATIRNATLAMSKGQKSDVNVANKVRNDLYAFLQWITKSYGDDYAKQVWEHFNLGDLRTESAKYERAGSPAPTEEYIDDVSSTMNVLIKHIQKMKDPAPAQPAAN